MTGLPRHETGLPRPKNSLPRQQTGLARLETSLPRQETVSKARNRFTKATDWITKARDQFTKATNWFTKACFNLFELFLRVFALAKFHFHVGRRLVPQLFVQLSFGLSTFRDGGLVLVQQFYAQASLIDELMLAKFVGICWQTSEKFLYNFVR